MFKTKVALFRWVHYVVDRTFSQVDVLRRFEGQLNFLKLNLVSTDVQNTYMFQFKKIKFMLRTRMFDAFAEP